MFKEARLAGAYFHAPTSDPTAATAATATSESRAYFRITRLLLIPLLLLLYILPGALFWLPFALVLLLYAADAR